MKVRCWGARGSIAVSGPEYVRHGGDTPCLELRSSGGEVLVVDAGTGIRRLGNLLMREGRNRLSLLFTHSHWDHIVGFPFFKPIYDPGAHIRMLGCPGFQGEVSKILAMAMRAPLFPVPFDGLSARLEPSSWCGDTLEVDTIKVTRIALSHPNLGAGYRFTEKGRSVVFLTDNELSHHHRGGRSFEEYVAFCKGADLLIHDAEYLPEEYPERKGWGHSHLLDAARLAREAGVGTLGLYHHNQDRTDDEVDAMVDRCRAALGGACECLALTQYSEFSF